jgi:outer membrane protein assembly factor BamA
MSKRGVNPYLLLPVGLLLAGVAPQAIEAQTSSHRRVFPVPVLGYAPETSLMFGVALVGVVSRDSQGPAKRPSTGLLTAIYTLKRQYQVELTLDHWTAGDAWHLVGYAGVERFPSQFNGIGTTSTDSSEIYTPQRLTLSVGAQRRIAPQLFAGASYWYRDARMVETESGGRLAPGTIPGSRGGTETILTLEGDWDTRDALYRTRHGVYLRLAYGIADRVLGAGFQYRRYTADGRWYRSLGAATVLAVQVVVDATDGTVPFDLLPHLGGSGILRGFAQPRFTDGAMSAAQIELRAPLKGIVSLVAFGGAGATAPSAGDLPRTPWRAAGGAGIRLLLDRTNGLQMRCDYALAAGSSGFYIGAGDAF